jgi:hypothetical protein
MDSTKVLPLGKVRTTNSTDTSFPARAPQAAKPTGNGVIDWQAFLALKGNGGVPTNLKLLPFGTGADDSLFDMLVIGWKHTDSEEKGLNGTAPSLWVPMPIVQVTCQLSTCIGVANRDVIATERFADKITGAAWNSTAGLEIRSPETNLPAWLMFDALGCSVFEVLFDLNTAASANALWGGV